jgi:ribosomal protein S18 acetylase RimI-like enzyme
MGGDRVELRPSVDREWLDAQARGDPLAHAYAVWDLERFPDRVRFLSAVRGGRTEGYLLIWPLPAGASVVHWVAPAELASDLAPSLPPRPLIVIAPDGAREAVTRARGPLNGYRVSVELAPPGHVPAPTPRDHDVRRLTPDDRERLVVFAQSHADRLGNGYANVDPGTVPVWGGFDRGRLVALANANVQLPRIWVVSGVFVDPTVRGQGWGHAVVRAVLAAAAGTGAACGLYVPETRAPARALYQDLGFRPVAERLWLDAGVDWMP